MARPAAVENLAEFGFETLPRVAAPHQPDETGHADHGGQWHHVDARSDGQSQPQAKKNVPAQLESVLIIPKTGGANGRIQGHRRQGCGPGVHGVKVGLLDGHDGRGLEEGGQQAHAPAVEACAD